MYSKFDYFKYDYLYLVFIIWFCQFNFCIINKLGINIQRTYNDYSFTYFSASFYLKLLARAANNSQ